MSLDGKWTARFRFVHLCTVWPLCTGYDPLLVSLPVKASVSRVLVVSFHSRPFCFIYVALLERFL
jgi:hypothetical protein